MILHPPTLLLCATLVMALAAALMSLFGVSQRVYRGYGVWTSAQGLAAIGLALHFWRDTHPALLPLANLLLMQWPVTLLTGFRMFYARRSGGLGPVVDWMLLATAYLLWLTTWVAHAGLGWRIAAYSLGMLLLHLHAANALWRLKGFPAGAALKTLLAVLLATAVVHGWRTVGSVSDHDVTPAGLLLAGAVVAVVCSVVMLYLGLLLTCERTHEELAASQHQLQALANIDTLTEVPNRRHFHELAASALALDPPGMAALLMIDIDHFKRINDRLGHQAGDAALREVARSMQASLRARDVAGRLGGDEFVALLPATSVQDALAVAERIVRPLGQMGEFRLSLSVGVVQMQPDEALAAALHRADQALYRAKQQGRNCAVVASGNDHTPIFTESMPLGLMAI